MNVIIQDRGAFVIIHHMFVWCIYISYMNACVSICRLVEKCPGQENVLANGFQDAEIGTNYLRVQMIHKRLNWIFLGQSIL